MLLVSMNAGMHLTVCIRAGIRHAIYFLLSTLAISMHLENTEFVYMSDNSSAILNSAVLCCHPWYLLVLMGSTWSIVRHTLETKACMSRA